MMANRTKQVEGEESKMQGNNLIFLSAITTKNLKYQLEATSYTSDLGSSQDVKKGLHPRDFDQHN